MTAPAPSAPVTPSVRAPRAWATAGAQTLLSLVVGLFLLLIVFGELLVEFADDPPDALVAMHGLDLVVGLVLSLAIGPLRFVPAGRAQAVLHLVIAAAGGISSFALPASAIALYRLGLRRRLLLDGTALALITLTTTAWENLSMRLRHEELTTLHLVTLGVMLLGALVPLLLGRVVGTRHELIRSLRERAASADRERETAQREANAVRRGHDAEVARVRAEERAALARDMHDSVSHHLAAIAMHAGAIAYREDLPPETLRHTAGTVRDAAQQANHELREVLVALRSSADDEPLATIPTLQETVDRARAAGQEATLDLQGFAPDALEQLGRGTVVALTRILSEALTNAAKHAPGSPVRAVLSRREDLVVLTVANPLSPGAAEAGATAEAGQAPSTGHGLIGVEERARLLGGGARWSSAAQTFEMEAWMPW